MSAKRKNGVYVGGNRTKSATADNLFPGIVHDVSSEKDRTMYFQKVARETYLMSAFDKSRKQNRMEYSRLESAVLEFFTKEDWSQIVGDGECEPLRVANAQLNVVLTKIDKTARDIAKTNIAMDADDVEPGEFRVYARKLSGYEAVMVPPGLVKEKDALDAAVVSARASCESLYHPEDLLKLIRETTPEANDVRLKLRTEIRKRVSRIDIAFHLRDDYTAIAIRYVNGVRHLGILTQYGLMPMPNIHAVEDVPSLIRSAGLEYVEQLKQGVPVATFNEMLKAAFVQKATQAE